jgi:dephospho-CoA kinase
VLIAGLTGGLASGKSFVAAELSRLGCHVVEADSLGHEVMLTDGAAYPAVVREFGEGILNPEREIDRARLAAIVFADPAALERLNSIVHPAVRALAARRFREIEQSDPRGIAIYVAAILVETGAYKEFAKLILAACTPERQIERALERALENSGATRAGVLERLARQLPLEEKRKVADYVIDTNGTTEETLRQTKMVFEDLRKFAQ